MNEIPAELLDRECRCADCRVGCDISSARLMDQAVAKFAETSAQTAAGQQQSYNLQLQSQWLQITRQAHEAQFNSSVLQLKTVERLFGATA